MADPQPSEPDQPIVPPQGWMPWWCDTKPNPGCNDLKDAS